SRWPVLDHRSLIQERSSDWKKLGCSDVRITSNISNRSFPVVPACGDDVSEVFGFANVPFRCALDPDNLPEPRHLVVKIVLFVSYNRPVMAPHTVLARATQDAASNKSH